MHNNSRVGACRTDSVLNVLTSQPFAELPSCFDPARHGPVNALALTTLLDLASVRFSKKPLSQAPKETRARYWRFEFSFVFRPDQSVWGARG